MQVSFEHRTTILVATSLQAPSCGSSMTANVAGLLLFTCFFCAQPFIAHRLAAKQAVQACCKASSTGLLQSKQYRFAAKQAVQVCCKASSTGLLQSKQCRFAAKQAVQVCCKAIESAAKPSNSFQQSKQRFAAQNWHLCLKQCVKNDLHYVSYYEAHLW